PGTLPPLGRRIGRGPSRRGRPHRTARPEGHKLPTTRVAPLPLTCGRGTPPQGGDTPTSAGAGGRGDSGVDDVVEAAPGVFVGELQAFGYGDELGDVGAPAGHLDGDARCFLPDHGAVLPMPGQVAGATAQLE